MPSTPEMLHDMLQRAAADPANCPGTADVSDSPTYRLPLAVSYRLWKENDMDASRALLHAVAIEIRSRSERGSEEIVARPAMAHAIPLLGQAALLETHFHQLRLVEPFIEKFRQQACEFRDFELLGRIGRLYKEIGDAKFAARPNAEALDNADDDLMGVFRPPWVQMYDKAFIVYRDAFDLTNDFYTGINAATLAALTGRIAEATDLAEKIVRICAPRHDVEQKDRYWLFATEGEALLILGQPASMKFYCEALNELTPANYGMADSSYRQLCRLWSVFTDKQKELADRVLKWFEASDARAALTPGFLGRPIHGARL
jgi:hypothetical protein